MLTIFSAPKPFTGHDRVIQLNAIRSWTLLRPSCEIILLGRDEGTAETAAELGIRSIPDIEYSELGTPLVSSLFQKAQDSASNRLMCYVNADIVLLSDFLQAVQRVDIKEPLIIGQRWDLDTGTLIDYKDPDWEARIRSELAVKGRLHPKSGMDYFVFPKGFYGEILPFALGRTAWDNWLVYRARSLGKQVIDITKQATVIHQNHDYRHVKGNRDGAFKGPEALRNQELLGGEEYSFNIDNATLVLTEKGLNQSFSFGRLFAWIDSVPVLYPKYGFLRVARKARLAAFSCGGRILRFLRLR